MTKEKCKVQDIKLEQKAFAVTLLKCPIFSASLDTLFHLLRDNTVVSS
jgi:hypothetical protein